MCRENTIKVNDLPTRIRTRKGVTPSTYNLDENEKQLIEEVLEKTKHNIKRAAELLAISRTTLYSKINKHGLREPRK
jgi:transcriptional regulator of acetoin/glycerol metabolism